VQPKDDSNKEDMNNVAQRPSRIVGSIMGMVIGVLVVITELMKSSPSDFHDSSKIGYLLVVLAFGTIGAVFGDKFIEKLAEWLRWMH
jgi:hypothetical protein